MTVYDRFQIEQIPLTTLCSYQNTLPQLGRAHKFQKS